MGTITIIEGSACGHRPSSGDRVVVRLPARAGRFAPHQLIRSTLPAVRQAATEPGFATLVASSRGALSLVFGGLKNQISDEESRMARALSSRLSSHLTHNIPMQELLWEQYASFLLAAHMAVPFVIVIEDLCHLDATSFAILLQLFRSDPDRAPDVVVGYTTDLPERVQMDARGIIWNIDRSGLKRSLAALRRLPVQHERGHGSAHEPCTCPIVRDVWDLCTEHTVEQMLGRPASELTSADVALIAPAILQAFSTFSFDTSLRLALDVLDLRLPLSAEDRASVCGVAALSAHNRQFSAQSNQRLAHFLRDSYRAALAHESDPGHRHSLYYRLAVTSCRRLGDLDDARYTIDTGLAKLATAQLPLLDKQLQKAWLHNIDALLQVRSGDVSAAFTCCEQAFHTLADATTPDHLIAAEVELSKLVVRENALTLASMAGNEPLRDLWSARGRDSLKIWPSLTVANILEQQRTHIDRLEIAQARELGVAALDLARSEFSPLLEYFALVCLSDLTFRLADYEAAAEYGDRARFLGLEVGDINGTQLALELRAAEIADARGRLDDAEQILNSLLAAVGGSIHLRAEVWGRLAGLRARRGDHARALELIAQSIDLTADSGELDLILRASCHAGDVASVLGLHEDAQAAYENCFELLGGTETSTTPSREILRLKAVLGQKRTGQPDSSQLTRCMQKLPGLLATDREAWPLARELLGLPLMDWMTRPEFEAAVRFVSDALACATYRTLSCDRL